MLNENEPSFNHYNLRGDVVAKTDDSGSLDYQAAYEAFGRHGDTESSEEWGTNPNRQQANTKDEDPTGLLNEGFRYRDLKTGTFITRDPLGMVDGPNVYTYVNQNPWTFFDPKGLSKDDAGDVDDDKRDQPDPKKEDPGSIDAGAWGELTPEQRREVDRLATQGAEKSARQTVEGTTIKEYSYAVYYNPDTGEIYRSEIEPGDYGHGDMANVKPNSPGDTMVAWGHSHPSNNTFSGTGDMVNSKTGETMVAGQHADIGVTNQTQAPGYVGRNSVKDPATPGASWEHTVTVDRVIPTSDGSVGAISTVSQTTSKVGPKSAFPDNATSVDGGLGGVFNYNNRSRAVSKGYHNWRKEKKGF